MDVVPDAPRTTRTTLPTAGRYRPLRRTTTGAGQTWAAHDERLHREVIVQSAPWRGESDRILHALATVREPVVAPLLDAGRDADLAYAVFPATSMLTLTGLLDGAAPITVRSVDAVADLLRDAVEAVEAASGATVALRTDDVLIDPERLDRSTPAVQWMPALGAPGRAARRRPDVDAVLTALHSLATPRRFAVVRSLSPRTVRHHPSNPPLRAGRRTACVSA